MTATHEGEQEGLVHPYGSKPKISSDAEKHTFHNQDYGIEHAHVIDKVIKACCMNHKVIRIRIKIRIRGSCPFTRKQTPNQAEQQ